MHVLKSLSLTTKIVSIVIILIILALVFGAGIAVGHRRAEFGSRWESHYGEVWSGPGSPFGGRDFFYKSIGGPGMMGGRVMGIGFSDTLDLPNGAAGKIVAVNLPTIAVSGQDDAEKAVIINAETTIRRMHAVATSTDLKVGDMVVVIGSPDEKGRIVASFIRVMPLMMSSTTRSW